MTRNMKIQLIAGAAAVWVIGIIIVGVTLLFSGQQSGLEKESGTESRAGVENDVRTGGSGKSGQSHTGPKVVRRTTPNKIKPHENMTSTPSGGAVTGNRSETTAPPIENSTRSADSDETSGIIRGKVSSDFGGFVKGASITARNLKSGRDFSATTDASGNFRITCRPGRYRVSAAHKDYLKSEPKDTAVKPDTPADIKFRLQVGSTLYGVVSSEASGAVIEGAAITVRNSIGGEIKTARTDARGIYTLSGLVHGAWLFSIRRDGYQNIDKMSVTVLKNQPKKLDLKLKPAASLIVHVTPPGDEVLDKISLGYKAPGSAKHYINLEGTDNTFTTTMSQGTYTLNLKCKGYLSPGDKTVTIKSGATHKVTFALERGCTLSGTITSEDGTPINDARVYVSYYDAATTRFSNASGTSDEKGGYLIRGLPDAKVQVSVKAKGYTSEKVKVDFEKTREIQKDFTLGRGVSCQGTILNNDGKPVPDVNVMLYNNKGGNASALSDSSGKFTISGLMPGKYTARAFHKKYGKIEKRNVEIHEGDNTLDLRYQGAYKVTGVLKGPDGKPVFNAFVFASPKDKSAHKDTHRARSDKKGRFELQSVRSDTYVMSIRHPDFKRMTREVAGGTEDLELILEPVPTIKGKVIDSQTGEPVRRFQIQVIDLKTSYPRERKSFNSEDGSFEMPVQSKRVKRIQIKAFSEGYAPAVSREIDCTAGMLPTDIELSLGPGHTLKGMVVSDSGVVKGATVTLYPGKGHLSRRSRGALKAVTAENGLFKVENAGDGEYTITVKHKDYADYSSTVKIGAETADLGEIKLDQGGSIVGSILSGGTPLPNVTVRAFNQKTRYYDHTRSDAEGAFSFTRLSPGEYTVTVIVRDKNVDIGSRAKKVKVTSGREAQIVFGK